MSDVAIRLDRLSKQYRIGRRERYKTLRDALTDSVSAAFRRVRLPLVPSSSAESAAPHFWALKDLSFEVPSGAVVGVIGRNGAGKSTLLKILSRITEPTEGRVEIQGRVGSLLEVGTGFHTELTGRENIVLNGAILGMRKSEITRKFDEIVAFAEVERFIDTPVKHYSSGMYMRLAFAVAAHLEPEILIVDEVLAVGDLQFQKKCLGKMGDVADDGRTVLLVSHQLNQIRKLCKLCVWLENGRIKQQGDSNDVTSAYEHALETRETVDGIFEGESARSRFLSWAIDGSNAEQTTTLIDDVAPTMRFRLRAAMAIERAHHGIALFNSENLLIWAHAIDGLGVPAGDHDLCYRFPVLPIKPGIYHWQLSLYNEDGLVDLWNAVPPLRVHTRPLTHASDGWQGVLNLPFTMEVDSLKAPTQGPIPCAIY